jgi:site-specific recombinase XerD
MMNEEMQMAITQFIEHVALRSPKRSTATHYESDLRLFARQVDKSPQQVTVQDVSVFVTAQSARGLKPKTINRRLATLHSFFEFLAIEAGDESWANPVIWSHHRIRQGSSLPRDLSDEAVKRLLDQVTHPRDRAMISVMLDLGLRVAEVAGLQVDDYEPASAPDQAARLRVRGKGDKERIVWLLPEIAAVLETWLQERPQSPYRALFFTRRGQAFSVRGIQERVEHYARQAGLHVTCHQLRHTCARRLAEGRMPLASLASWLGHASPTTTQVYINGANLSVRADYEAARNRLQAERPQPPTANAPTEFSVEASAVPAGQPVEEWPYPELSVQEIRERVASLPDWLQPWLEEWVLVQQARWLPRYRRQRARQWLREVQKAWAWLVSQRSIQGFADLQGADLIAYLDTWQDRVSSGTVNHFLTSFWPFLRYVEAQSQPVAPGLYRLPRPKQPERLPRPLKEEEYRRLEQTVLEASAEDDPVSCLDRLCFLLMAHAGLRIGELQNLRLEDWHPAQQRLVVRQGKDNQDRAVPLSPETTAALEAYLVVRESVPLPHLLVYQGRPLGQDFIRNHLHQYADRAGLKRVTPHRLRHTCATRLLNAGMPVTSVQTLLGHENLATTMGYAQLYDDTVRKDYQAAVAQLQGQSPTEESEPNGSPAPLVEPAVSPSVPVTGPTAAAVVVIGFVCVNVLSFAATANCM